MVEPRRQTLNLRKAIALLRVSNDIADEKGWSMVSVHLQTWSEVMLARRVKDDDTWLRRQLEGMGK